MEKRTKDIGSEAWLDATECQAKRDNETFWCAVDKDGWYSLSKDKPVWFNHAWQTYNILSEECARTIGLPYLSWEDEPIQIRITIEKI